MFKSVLCKYAENAMTEPLSWELRMRIAIGAAKGLAFLHSSEKQIIYRDFKASNILLDGVNFLIMLQYLHFFRDYVL